MGNTNEKHTMKQHARNLKVKFSGIKITYIEIGPLQNVWNAHAIATFSF
jgi:hypothetical protein